MTAAEAVALLQQDPEWVRDMEDREAKWKAEEARLRALEDPIIVDLASVGIEVDSVWDLVNTSASYPEAIPTLIKHLGRPYDPRIRSGLARSLTVREAKGLAGEVLLQQLRHETNREVRWTLANALTMAADKRDVDAMKALLGDPNYADVHERLRSAVRKAARR
jgi:hypothetical protein